MTIPSVPTGQFASSRLLVLCLYANMELLMREESLHISRRLKFDYRVSRIHDSQKLVWPQSHLVN